MDREIIFEKRVFENAISLYLNAIRYTSKIVDRSTRVKSAERGKIFKTTSVTNLSAFSNNLLKSKVNDTFLTVTGRRERSNRRQRRRP